MRKRDGNGHELKRGIAKNFKVRLVQIGHIIQNRKITTLDLKIFTWENTQHKWVKYRRDHAIKGGV